jgi:DNA-binding MarR family transcriptional regulator
MTAAAALKIRKPELLPMPQPANQRLEIRIWLRMLSCTTQIENVIKSNLRREFDTTLARFDVLAQLDRFPNGLTMSEVSRHLMVSNGAVTALVDKLEASGFVSRADHEQDKRTVIVRLTEAGRAQFRRMARRHEEWIVSLLGDLSREAQTELLRDLTLLKHVLIE